MFSLHCMTSFWSYVLIRITVTVSLRFTTCQSVLSFPFRGKSYIRCLCYMFNGFRYISNPAGTYCSRFHSLSALRRFVVLPFTLRTSPTIPSFPDLPVKGTGEICNQTDGGGGLSRRLSVQNLRIFPYFEDPVGPPPMSRNNISKNK